jgi:putative tricarboxylic transport membrane protein
MELFFQTLGVVLSPSHFIMLIAGVLMGMAIGILPGLGGITGMTILLPVIYGMEVHSAFALLIGMVAVIPTSDTFPSVMMGIPGSSASQATILDGYPLAKKGEAARALGAAFTASLIGGLFGAMVLTIIIPIARPIVLLFASPELFMLALLGISMVGVLSGQKPIKGFITAGIGLMIGALGDAPAVPEYRYAFGIDYLMDGVPLVIVGLGLFAVPEIIDLLIKGRSISRVATLGKGWLDGVKDALNHKFIILRCSVIGVIVGFLPGLGGSVVDWIAYGHVVQTSKDRENFGRGDIRGVIAPESANNAKEGGGLIPTFLFGIPGSGSMAVFLGGLLILGIEPGPSMVGENVDLIYTAIWSLALANVFGAGLSIFLSKPITRLTIIPFSYLAPFLVLIITFASYQASRSWGDLFALLLMGLLGWIMKQYGWPRPAALIGFVLSDNLETYLFISVQRYGFGWMARPGVLALALIILASVSMGIFYQKKKPSGSREKHEKILS